MCPPRNPVWTGIESSVIAIFSKQRFLESCRRGGTVCRGSAVRTRLPILTVVASIRYSALFNAIQDGPADRIGPPKLCDRPLDGGGWSRAGTNYQDDLSDQPGENLSIRQYTDRRCVDQHPVKARGAFFEHLCHAPGAQACQGGRAWLSACQRAQTARHLRDRELMLPILKGFAQTAIVRDIQNGMQGRAAQVGVNHQYPARVRFAESKGEVDDRQCLSLVRQRAGDHHGLRMVLCLRLVQHGAKPAVLLERHGTRCRRDQARLKICILGQLELRHRERTCGRGWSKQLRGLSGAKSSRLVVSLPIR